MGMWTVEWSDCDVHQCRFELYQLWISDEFRGCLATHQVESEAKENGGGKTKDSTTSLRLQD